MNDTARVEADPEVPMIHIYRDFAATPERVMRAHVDPEIFAKWIGPDPLNTRVDYWDARPGGSWRFVSKDGDAEHGFHGCFHEVRPGYIVQTFTWEGDPDGVALETLTLTDLGEGSTRLHTTSLCSRFAAREGWLTGGMESGVDQGYANLDRLLRDAR